MNYQVKSFLLDKSESTWSLFSAFLQLQRTDKMFSRALRSLWRTPDDEEKEVLWLPSTRVTCCLLFSLFSFTMLSLFFLPPPFRRFFLPEAVVILYLGTLRRHNPRSHTPYLFLCDAVLRSFSFLIQPALYRGGGAVEGLCNERGGGGAGVGERRGTRQCE